MLRFRESQRLRRSVWPQLRNCVPLAHCPRQVSSDCVDYLLTDLCFTSRGDKRFGERLVTKRQPHPHGLQP